MCRGAEGRQETQLFGGPRVCAYTSKHFCSFLHCMHIWKLVHLIVPGTYSAWRSAIFTSVNWNIWKQHFIGHWTTVVLSQIKKLLHRRYKIFPPTSELVWTPELRVFPLMSKLLSDHFFRLSLSSSDNWSFAWATTFHNKIQLEIQVNVTLICLRVNRPTDWHNLCGDGLLSG